MMKPRTVATPDVIHNLALSAAVAIAWDQRLSVRGVPSNQDHIDVLVWTIETIFNCVAEVEA
jgi:hypothetical protein